MNHGCEELEFFHHHEKETVQHCNLCTLQPQTGFRRHVTVATIPTTGYCSLRGALEMPAIGTSASRVFGSRSGIGNIISDSSSSSATFSFSFTLRIHLQASGLLGAGGLLSRKRWRLNVELTVRLARKEGCSDMATTATDLCWAGCWVLLAVVACVCYFIRRASKHATAVVWKPNKNTLPTFWAMLYTYS